MSFLGAVTTVVTTPAPAPLARTKQTAVVAPPTPAFLGALSPEIVTGSKVIVPAPLAGTKSVTKFSGNK